MADHLASQVCMATIAAATAAAAIAATTTATAATASAISSRGGERPRITTARISLALSVPFGLAGRPAEKEKQDFFSRKRERNDFPKFLFCFCFLTGWLAAAGGKKKRRRERSSGLGRKNGSLLF